MTESDRILYLDELRYLSLTVHGILKSAEAGWKELAEITVQPYLDREFTLEVGALKDLLTKLQTRILEVENMPLD